MKHLDWIDIGLHCLVAFACGLLGWGAALVISLGFIWREAEQFRWKYCPPLGFVVSFNPFKWSEQKRWEAFAPIPFAILGVMV